MGNNKFRKKNGDSFGDHRNNISIHKLVRTYVKSYINHYKYDEEIMDEFIYPKNKPSVFKNTIIKKSIKKKVTIPQKKPVPETLSKNEPKKEDKKIKTLSKKPVMPHISKQEIYKDLDKKLQIPLLKNLI